MTPPMKLSRRAFLAGLGAGLAVGVMPRVSRADEPSGAGGTPPPPKKQDLAGLVPHVLVHIALDGTTTIICHRSEMGQGIKSSLPVLIGDELGADPARVVVVQADGDKKYGDQNTDGSTSIRKGYDELRRAGAAARMMLVAAAAKKWKVKPETCTTENHQIIHKPTKRTLAFADVVAAAAKLPVPKKDIVLRPLGELKRVADPNLPLIDGAGIVTGTAQFGADVKLPGMVYAVIARPPVVGGKVAKYDATRALKVPGVKKIVEMPVPTAPWLFQPWGGIAVVADTTWAAIKGRAALDITWDHGPNASYNSDEYREQLLASVRAPGTKYRDVGNIDNAFSKAAKTVEAEYVVPHLSHMQMEPLVAVARIMNGTAEVWAPTQNPQDNREDVAKILGLPEDKVTIHVTLLGGGFGRKSKSDFEVEAAWIAKHLDDGVPVRVQWTRDDDVKHGYYNAVNAQRLRAALDDKGTVTAWHHKTAFTPIGGTFDPKVDTPSLGDLQQGVLDLALAAPNVRAEACKAPLHTRVGWFRSVYNIFHAFAIGSFIDEIAHARGTDPRDTWLDVIGPARKFSLADLGVTQLRNYGESLDKHPVDAGRLRKVIERVTEMAGWGNRNGRALGLAAHRSFVSYTAVVISVVPDPVRVFRIDNAWISMDPGTVVNKDRVHSQMEGAVVMGISNALYGGVTMTKGATDQSNFRDARVARMRDVPHRIHTDLVESTEPPSGVGEPGVPPVGAALANAIFALTGKRLREVPLAKALKI
ncbi:MAG: xanthine dehydrogenase family protein molybdopterin-binding subunit [Kofleriaceae bacterium]|nr:xanthine dehydrogenase family protein molybdopterin-binding subunit [Kofleriaceae bacterium]